MIDAQPLIPVALPTMPLLGVEVVSANADTVMGAVRHSIEQRTCRHFAFLNANNANIAMVDPNYRAALANAVVLPDGVGVDVGARILHGKKYAENLNGTDFVPALLRSLPAGTKVGLYGAAPGVAEQACRKIENFAPDITTRVIADGFVRGDQETQALQSLADWGADLLIVAMGTPRQEMWIEANITDRHAGVVLSVGALFDFLSGTVSRAPDWMRQARLEWVYRLWLEPDRLWKRYIIGNPRFLLHVVAEKMQRRSVKP